VGRVSLNVLEESSVGVIVTNGDPNSNDNNALYGADFRYIDSNFRGDKTLRGDLWFQRTNSEGLSQDQSAFGGRLDYPNDIWNWTLRYAEFEENYNPALGFLSRSDIREYTGRVRYRVRPAAWLRTIDTQVTSQVFTNRDNNLESVYLWVDPLDLSNNYEDRLRLRWTWRAERPDTAFDIVDVTIPADNYTWNRGSVLMETSRGRPVGLNLDVGWGQYYDGTRFDLISTLQLRPSPHFNAELEWNQTKIRVEGGDVTTRLVRLRLNANVTPDLSWNTTIQYENVNRTVGLNSRIRWIVQPGDEIFLVVNHGFDVLPRNGASSVNDRVTTRFNTITFKAVYTFRF
jgi:hypothetical protein